MVDDSVRADPRALFHRWRQRLALLTLLTVMPGVLPGQPSPPTSSGPSPIVLLEMEGTVEVSRAGSPLWDPGRPNQPLLPGDRVRTGDRSRAVIRLSDHTLVRKGPRTIIELPAATSSGLRLLQGILYFFHRDRPRDFPVVTPACYAAIVGTEFSLSVKENGETILHVIDGQVEMTNAFGNVSLRSGESGAAAPGRAPERTAALTTINAVQWCIYYPGVLHLDDLSLSADEKSALAESLQAYAAGDLLGALRGYPLARAPVSGSEGVYLAALLLGVGEVESARRWLDEVQPGPEARRVTNLSRVVEALRLVIAAVQRQSASAAAEEAGVAATTPGAETPATRWLAQSYWEQSRLRLDAAREAAGRSVELAPEFSFGWVRLAELEFSFGRVNAARAALERGLELGPRNAQAHALRGFLLAAENRTAEALASFEQALALDGALGNAWLGRGLCQIRRGQLERGRQDLQVAATLEPQRSVLRSYLGKAFQETGEPGRASAELNLAKALDEADPTAWLYSALLHQQHNQINEAVRDLEKSKELNEHRSVYRSGLLLDQDRAVQGANLASVYRDASMTDVSVREAAQAIHEDYANASAHLFLAESYNALRDPRQVNLRYETPWLSEFLVASLLAPPGAGTLSPYVTQQEYARLFERDRFGLVSSTEYSSRGDWVQNASQYGTWGDTAYAADVSYRSENGDRPNADLTALATTLRLQHQLTPRDSLFLQGTYYESEFGDVRPYYDPSAANRTLRQEESQAPLLLAGLHHEWSPSVHTLVVAGLVQDTLEVHNDTQGSVIVVTNLDQVHIDGVVPFTLEQQYRSRLQLFTTELQQLVKQGDITVVAGARWQTADFDTRNVHTNAMLTSPLNNLTQGIAYQRTTVLSEMDRASAYLYPQLRVLEPLLLLGGLSYDYLRFPDNYRVAPITEGEESRSRLSPKAGWIWTPDKATAVRGAYTRALGGVSLDQSFQLEPTQVAGFVQTYRSLLPEAVVGANAAPTFETLSASIERKLGAGTYLGLLGEILRSEVHRQVGVYGYVLDLTTPIPSFLTTPAQTRERLEFQEQALTFSANQLLGNEWSLGARYRLSEATLRDVFQDLGTPPTVPGGFQTKSESESVLHQLNLFALYNHPSGFFGQAEALWFHQHPGGALGALPDEDLWQFNLMGGYRFWQRRVEASAGVLNLSDRDYRLHPLNVTAAVPRERTFVARLKIYF